MDVTVCTPLKLKVIEGFSLLVKSLQKGHKLDYEQILEEISFINSKDELMFMNMNNINNIELFYINNKWQTHF